MLCTVEVNYCCTISFVSILAVAAQVYRLTKQRNVSTVEVSTTGSREGRTVHFFCPHFLASMLSMGRGKGYDELPFVAMCFVAHRGYFLWVESAVSSGAPKKASTAKKMPY